MNKLDWFTVPEAARVLGASGVGIHQETLRRWIRAGEVKVVKPSPRKTLVSADELERLAARLEGRSERPTWLTPREVQEELRLGERAVYRLLRSGEIPSVRVGGVYRINSKVMEDLAGRARGERSSS